MNSRHLPRLARYAPLAAALLGSAALAAPAGAQAPVGAPAVPFVALGANTSDVLGEELHPGPPAGGRGGGAAPGPAGAEQSGGVVAPAVVLAPPAPGGAVSPHQARGTAGL